MKIHSLFVIIFTILATSVYLQQSKLIFVQQLFRHGARYPIYPSSLDGSHYAISEHSTGELTSQGKAMHYMLGKMLFNDYWHKLFQGNMRYNQSKFYFKSTNVNRTIESVQSQLLGLFENIESVNISDADLKYSKPAWNYTLDRQSGFVFENSPKFHSLPVHVQKSVMSPWDKADFLRTYNSQTCYKQNEWMEVNKQDKYVQEIVSHPSLSATVDKVNHALYVDSLGFFDIHKFIDNAQTMLYMGKTPLPIFTEDSQTKQDLATIYALQGYIKMFYTQEQLSATATGYFNQTVNNFKKVIADKKGVQWAFYSAHDTTIMNMISRLGLTGVQCIYQNYLNGTYFNNQTQYCIVEYPTYASTLIFQIYQNSDRPHTFKIRYNGNYRRIPICNWAYQCAVTNMYSWYQKWKDEDYVKTCGINNEDAETLFSITMIELGIIVILLVYLLKKHLDKQAVDPKDLVKDYPEQQQRQKQAPAAEMLKESLISQQEEMKQ